MTGSNDVKLYGSGSSTKVGTDACVSCGVNGQGGEMPTTLQLQQGSEVRWGTTLPPAGAQEAQHVGIK